MRVNLLFGEFTLGGFCFNADEQKIAKKLCCSIAKESKRIRILLEDYNAAAYELQSEESTVSLADVLSLGFDFWTHASHSNCSSGEDIPWKVKEEICQVFLMIQRSDKELVMLKADMLSTVAYWFKRRTSIARNLMN